MTLTADNITDAQIRELRRDASDHAVTVICKQALATTSARKALDAVSLEAFEADQGGPTIEFLNERILNASRDLGLALQARARCAEILNARSKT